MIGVSELSASLGERMQQESADVFYQHLLQLLITHRGKVYSREALLETVWKYDYMGDMRTVDVHIRRLREKIERDNTGPEFILTKWGVGYYFTDKD